MAAVSGPHRLPRYGCRDGRRYGGQRATERGHTDGVAPPAVPELLDLYITESPLDFGVWGDFETSWTALCSAEQVSTTAYSHDRGGDDFTRLSPEVASYCAASTTQGSAPEDSGPPWYQGVLADMVVPSTSTFDSTHLLPNQGTVGRNILALEGPLDIEGPNWQPPPQSLVIQPTILRFHTPDVERPTPSPSGSVSNGDLFVVPTAPSGRDVQTKQSKRKSPTEDQRQSLAALTYKQCEALAYVQQTAEVYQLKTSTMAGDLTFVNNWAVVHGRESFEDSPKHSRYLVRMWLKNEHLAWTLPEPLRFANNMVFYDQELPENWNLNPGADIKFEIYEKQSP